MSDRTVDPADATASDVAEPFAANGAGSAQVVDPASPGPLRIVTESDVMRQVAGRADVTAVRAASFMTSLVVTVDGEVSIDEAAGLMREHSVRRLPVVAGDDVVGMLTSTDLTHYMPRLLNDVLRSRGDLARQ